MSYEVLEKKIKQIPSEYLEEFSVYVDDFFYRHNSFENHESEADEKEKLLEDFFALSKHSDNDVSINGAKETAEALRKKYETI